VIRVIDVAQEKTKIQGQGKHDEEREHDFFEIHGSGAPF
jgi:hypothetical protein